MEREVKWGEGERDKGKEGKKGETN